MRHNLLITTLRLFYASVAALTDLLAAAMLQFATEGTRLMVGESLEVFLFEP